MGMVENQKKFYLYDRWFEYQNETNGNLVYLSVPKNSSYQTRIEINTKTNKMTLFYIEDKKELSKIEISDLTKTEIEIHYMDNVCGILEIEENKYDNLAIELFATIKNNSITHDIQIMFTKMDKESKFPWKDPGFSVNQKIDLDNFTFTSDKVNSFIDFTSGSIIHFKKIRNILSLQESISKEVKLSEMKEIIIPQELTVYDRVYHLTNITENKIILTNREEEVRNLEIRYDPILLSLLSISLIIKKDSKNKNIIRIIPNELDGITVKYCNKKKEKVLIGNKVLEIAKIHSEMIYNSENKKIETNVLISSEKERIKLLEHPFLRNNYTDGSGNLCTIGNSGYNTFYSIASYAPGIVYSLENKVFKKK